VRGLFYITMATGILLTSSCQTSAISFDQDEAMVKAILSDLDSRDLSTNQQMENYLADAVLLVPDQKEIRGEAALKTHLDEFGSNENIEIKHQIVELDSFNDVVIAQGRVVGLFTADDEENSFPFETKNVILFKRSPSGDLKIWKVIYNAAPVS